MLRTPRGMRLGTPILWPSQTYSSALTEPEKQIVYMGLRGTPGIAGWGRAKQHRAQGLPSHENSRQCRLHGNYTAKGQAEWMDGGG